MINKNSNKAQHGASLSGRSLGCLTLTTLGFTLIELMVTVAIISMLAAIALPAYREYVVKSQITEVFTRLNSVQADVVKEYSRTGACPASTITVNGKYLTSITVTAPSTSGSNNVCIIQANLNQPGNPEGIDNRNLGMALVDNAGTLSWRCPLTGISNPVDPKYLPLSCQDT